MASGLEHEMELMKKQKEIEQFAKEKGITFAEACRFKFQEAIQVDIRELSLRQDEIFKHHNRNVGNYDNPRITIKG